jgi:MFS superfamily sulfate permease-like transporter
MGFLEALTLAFIILKLVGAIAWPWWGVLAPLYPAAVIWVLIALFGVKFWKRNKKQRKEFTSMWHSFGDDGPW